MGLLKHWDQTMSFLSAHLTGYLIDIFAFFSAFRWQKPTIHFIRAMVCLFLCSSPVIAQQLLSSVSVVNHRGSDLSGNSFSLPYTIPSAQNRAVFAVVYSEYSISDPRDTVSVSLGGVPMNIIASVENATTTLSKYNKMTVAVLPESSLPTTNNSFVTATYSSGSNTGFGAAILVGTAVGVQQTIPSGGVQISTGCTSGDVSGGGQVSLPSVTASPTDNVISIIGVGSAVTSFTPPNNPFRTGFDATSVSGPGFSLGYLTYENTSAASMAFSDTVSISEGCNNRPIQVQTILRPFNAEVDVVLSISSYVDSDSSGTVNVGDVLNYSIDVTNTGNVPLSNVLVEDVLRTNRPNRPPLNIVGGFIGNLDPGITNSTASGSYVLDIRDQADGFVEFNVGANGTPVGGGTPIFDLSDTGTLPIIGFGSVPGTSQDVETVTSDPVLGGSRGTSPPNGVTDDDPTLFVWPSGVPIALEKGVSGITDVNRNGVTDPGDIIRYSFTIDNNSPFDLRDIRLDDPKVAVSGGPVTVARNTEDSTTYTAAYTVLDADVPVGGVENSANVTARAYFPGTNVPIPNIFNLGQPYEGFDISDADTYPILSTTLDPANGPTITPVTPGPGEILTNNLAGNGIQPADDDPTVVVVGPTPPQNDLAISFNPVTSVPVQGYTSDFTLEITNESTVDSTGVSVLIPVPNGYTFRSSNSIGNYDVSGGVWTVGDLGGGQSQSLVLSLAVRGSGDYDLVAEIQTSDQLDIDSTVNNSSTNEDDDDQLAVTTQRGTGGVAPPLTCSTSFQTFDWASSNWVANQNVQTVTSGGVEVRSSFDGSNVSAGGAFGHILDSGFTGGFPPRNLLRHFANFGDLSDSFDMRFGVGPVGVGVESLSFRLFDVDIRSNYSWVDAATIVGYSGGAQVNPTLIAEGAGVSISGNRVTGILSAGNSTGLGNVRVVFSQPIDGFSIIVAPGLTANNTGNQGTSISDLTVCPTPAPALTVAKTISSSSFSTPLAANDTITYQFVVENTGNVNIDAVTPVDAGPTFDGTAGTGAALSFATTDATDLAPGGIATFTATYTLTAADVAAVTGSAAPATSIANSATASGTPVSGSLPPVPPSTTQTGPTPAPAIELTKSIASVADTNGNGLTDAGDIVTYIFNVRNTGDTALADVTITDAKLGISNVAVSPVDLTIGASATLSGQTYTILDTDVSAGGIENTALTSGRPVAMGSGNVPDPTVPVVDITGTALPNVQDTSDTGTASELDSSGIPFVIPGNEIAETPNLVDVTDNDPTNDPTVLLIPNPQISLIKSVATVPDTNGDALFGGENDVVTFSFLVRNVGNVDLKNVVVSDPMVTMSGGPIADLAVGAGDSLTFTGTYVVQAADIARGYIENTATATGDAVDGNGNPLNGPTGTPITVSDISDAGTQGQQQTVTNPENTESPDGDPNAPPNDNQNDPTDDPTVQVLPSNPNPTIQLVKAVTSIADTNNSGTVDAGDTVSYSFAVTNTGNVRLAGVTVNDPRANPVSGAPITLELGQTDTTTFTASAVITAAEAAAGKIENTATATGNAVNSTGDAINDPNTGNPLTATDISDTGSEPEIGVSGVPTPIPDPAGNGNGGDDPTELLLPKPEISLEKSVASIADTNNSGQTDAGDTITYSFDVTNSGDTALTNITVTDPLPDLTFTTPVTIANLAIGATDSAVMATYVLKPADVAAGFVENTAVANGTAVDDGGDPFGDPFNPGQLLTVTDTSDTGTTPQGDDIPNPPSVDTPDNTGTPDGSPGDDPTVAQIPPTAQIELTKSIASVADTNSNGLTDAGDVVSYTFTVINTGNVALNNVTLTDPLVAVSGGPVNLPIGGSDTGSFTALYTLLAADVAAGAVENTATAQGTAVDANGNTLPDPNNPGQPLTATDVSDSGTEPNLDNTGTPPTINNPSTVETPNKDGGNDGDPANDPTVLRIDRPDISLIKSVANVLDNNIAGGDGLFGGEGDEVVYQFTVRNTGNIDLADVQVNDALIPVSGGPISLAVGAGDTLTFTGSYIVTAADVARGYIENTATVTGSGVDAGGLPLFGPNGAPVIVTDTSDAGTKGKQETVPNPEGEETPSGDPQTDPPNGDPTDDPTVQVIPSNPNPSIVLVKSVQNILDTNNSNLIDAGDTVNYTFSVTNNGNVRLGNVVIDDPRANPVAGGPITLDLGQTDTATFTASAVITAAEAAAGLIENTATATGGAVSSLGDPITDNTGAQLTTTDTSDTGSEPELGVSGQPTPIPDPAGSGTGGDDPTQLVLPMPEITLEKSVAMVADTNNSGAVDVGDVVSYTFDVTNSGNADLVDITVADPLPGLTFTTPVTIASLAQGATNSTVMAVYALTAADVATGFVENTANAVGTAVDGGGTPFGDPFNPGQPLQVTDTSDAGTTPQGDDIPNPPVTDTPPGGPIGSTPPNNIPGDDPTVLAITPTPEIQLTKSIASVTDVNGNDLTDVGDTVNYVFTATNTGNVALGNVTLDDPLATVAGGPITLAIGASDSTSFTATYTLRTQDIDASGVENTATARGTALDAGGNEIPDPNNPNDPLTITDTSDSGTQPELDSTGTPVSVPTPETTETPNLPGVTDNDPTNDPTVLAIIKPEITLVKSVANVLDSNNDGLFGGEDDTVIYSFLVRNTGDVALTGLTVTDNLVAVTGGPVDLAIGAGDSTSFTANYTVTAADLARGYVENTANATGTPANPDGSPIFGPNGTPVTVTDVSDAGTEGNKVTVPNPETEETPNGDPSVPPNGDPGDDPTVQVLPSNPNPEITLVKSVSSIVDTNNSSVVDAGDTVNYAFRVTNTGNVRLADVSIDDPRANPVAGGPITLDLMQTDTATFTASAVLTQAEATAGRIVNTAVATGGAVNSNGDPIRDPNTGNQRTATDTSDTGTEPKISTTGVPTRIDDPAGSGTGEDPTELVLPMPQIVLEKSVASIADSNNSGTTDQGDAVTYTFTITNTGNTDLTNVVVDDPLPGLLFTTPVRIASLAQGASDTSVRATHNLLAAEVVAGFAENTATATGNAVDENGTPLGDPFNPGQPLTTTDTSDAGTDPDGLPIANPPGVETPGGNDTTDGDPKNDPTVVKITPAPRLQLTKSIASVADTNGNSLTDAGDVVTYAFTVTNTGNVAIAGAQITDPLVTVVGAPIDLAIGASDATNFSATYTLTAADVAAGAVENTATATGTAVDAGGTPIDDPANPGTPLTATDTSDSGTNPALDNTGNPTPVFQPELNETPNAQGVTNNDPADDPTVLRIDAPQISLVKSVANVLDINVSGGDGLIGGEGDEVVYKFVVRNTGNVALTGVSVSDPLIPVSGGPIDLAVGAGDSLTFTGSYIVTAADFARGYIENSATVTGTGTDPSGNPIFGPDGTPVTVTDVSDAGTQGQQEDVPNPEEVESPDGNPNGPQTDDPNDPTDDPTVQVIPSNPRADVTLVKSVASIADSNGSGLVDAGDTVTYAFTVSNTGNVRLDDVTIDDPRANPVSGGPITLNVGAVDTATFTANAVITEAEATGGLIENTATATGNGVNSAGTPITPNGVPLVATDTSDSGTGPEISVTGKPKTLPDPEGEGTPEDPTQLVLPKPEIVLEKSVATVADTNNSGAVDAGDTVRYTFDVTNAGNTDLVNITVADPLPGLTFTTPVTIATLAQGATDSTVAATYILTNADILAGFVENTATATGTAVDGDGDPYGDPFNPGQPLQTTDRSDAGTDPQGNDIPNPPATQTDPNNPTGTTPPNGDPTDDPTVLSIRPKPGIQVTKSIASVADTNANGLTDAGDVVSYTFEVNNTGNVALSGVRVSDPKAVISGGPIDLPIAGRDTATFTATYAIAPEDVTAGGVENTARAIGIATAADGTPIPNPNNPASPLTVEDVSDAGTNPDLDANGTPTPVIDPEKSETPDLAKKTDNDPTNDPTVLAISRPAISVVKSVANVFDTNQDGLFGGENDQVAYTFVVRNTGNVALTNVTITDGLAPVTGGPIDLAVGAGDSQTFTATYVVTAADVTRGYVENTATATGDAVDPLGNPVFGPDGTPLTVTDVSDAGTTGRQEDVPNPETTETPRGDPEANPPNGDPTDDPTVQTLPSNANPSLIVVKSISDVADTNNSGAIDAGDTVSYRFTVTNNGNVRLDGVVLDDARAPVTGGSIALDIGQSDSRTFRATAVITAEEAAAGSIVNTAIATGNAVNSQGDPLLDPETGTPLTARDTSDAGTEPELDETGTPPAIDDPAASGTGGDDPTVLSLPNPQIEIVKSVARVVDTGGDGLFGNIGDLIEYTFTVSNTGNTSLQNVTVNDVNANVVGGPVTLAVGGIDSTTFTGSHVVIRQELTQGFVQNTATATGTPVNADGDPVRGPDGTPLTVTDVSDTATNDEGEPIPDSRTTETPDGLDVTDADPTNDPTVINVPTNPRPQVRLVKSVDAVADTNDDFVTGAVDDVATYRFDVTNTGNTALQNVVVNDLLLGGVVATIPALALNQTVSVFGNYTIVAEDEPRGFIQNTATATGLAVNPVGDPILDPSGDQLSTSDVSDAGTSPDGTAIDTPEGQETPDGSAVSDDDPTNDPTVINLPFRPSDLLISGTVFLDNSGDGTLGAGDDPSAGAGYLAVLLDSDGNEVQRAVTGANGTYSLAGFPLGDGYVVEFRSPEGVTVGRSAPFDMTRANPTRTDIDQPIDPGGVIYNSTTGDPVAGVTVTLTDSRGTPLPAACLGTGQQGQVTAASGAYNFDINVGANNACPVGETEYRIAITDVPEIFSPAVSTVIPPQTGPLDTTNCTSGGATFDAVPGGSCQPSASLEAPSPSAPTPYFLTFTIASGDPDTINNHIPIDLLTAVDPVELAVTKVVTTGVSSVIIGEAVPYTMTITNPMATAVNPASFVDALPNGMLYLPGSAQVNGVDVEPTVNGRTLTFEGLNVAPTSVTTVTLTARVAVNAPLGDLTNRAYVADPGTGDVISNVAIATVIRRPEAVFDCSDIIGKVFDDRNANGYQDDPDDPISQRRGGFNFVTDQGVAPGKFSAPQSEIREEPGLPHVRLVTQTGTIITTDEFGRYSMPCAELPGKMGANFSLKLDERSLPTGYRMTTENPRTMRVTAGIMTEMNFGASISRVVDVDLTVKAFKPGSTQPSDALVSGMQQLLKAIKDTPSVIRIAYFHEGEDKKTIRARGNAVEKMIRKQWKRTGRYKLIIERTIKRIQ